MLEYEIISADEEKSHSIAVRCSWFTVKVRTYGSNS